MSDEDNRLIEAHYKDGQLQIVEVNPFATEARPQIRNMPDLNSGSSSDNEPKYVLNSQKNLVPLDLLNLTLVRCEDSYQLIANTDSSKSGSDTEVDQTVTCVLQSEGSDNQYVIVNNERCPVMLLQSSIEKDDVDQSTSVEEAQFEEKPQIDEIEKSEEKEPKEMTPEEILEKAREVARTLTPREGGARGRKRKSDLPPPHELLSSPNFKLYLYSCRICTFKCNAIKELTAHKAAEHGGGRYRGSGGVGKSGPQLQCARCPYRANHHHQLMKHVQDKHLTDNTVEMETLSLDSIEAEEADVLVCGACGFESVSKVHFKKHIEKHIVKSS